MHSFVDHIPNPISVPMVVATGPMRTRRRRRSRGCVAFRRNADAELARDWEGVPSGVNGIGLRHWRGEECEREN